MALNQSKKSPSGAVAKYWRIAGVLIHEWEKNLEVILAGYIDEATRRALNEDGEPEFKELMAVVVRVTPDQWATLFSEAEVDYPSKATLYEFIKTLPEWQGAKDA
jgi:hypothetical protein